MEIIDNCRSLTITDADTEVAQSVDGLSSPSALLSNSSSKPLVGTNIDDRKRLRDLSNIPSGSTDCLHFVDLDRYTNDCMKYILSELILEEGMDDARRKKPPVITSFARGGKTTAICTLFDKLSNSRCCPIVVTCNGSSNFALLLG